VAGKNVRPTARTKIPKIENEAHGFKPKIGAHVG